MNTLLLTLTLIFLSNPVMGDHDKDSSKTEEQFVLASDLITAIHHVDMVSVSVLLAEGAQIDTVDVHGNTPLMVASKIGNPRIIRLLLAHEPNINAKNLDGETALMIAAENGQYHVARQLVVRGARLNAQNAAGFTAKELALRNGQSQIVHLLNEEAIEISAR